MSKVKDVENTTITHDFLNSLQYKQNPEKVKKYSKLDAKYTKFNISDVIILSCRTGLANLGHISLYLLGEANRFNKIQSASTPPTTNLL